MRKQRGRPRENFHEPIDLDFNQTLKAIASSKRKVEKKVLKTKKK